MTEEALFEKFRQAPPSEAPYTAWLAEEAWGDRIAIFAARAKDGRLLRVCRAGISCYPSPKADRAELERLGAPWELRFSIDGEPQPDFPFYPAPRLEIFAWNAEGWLGSLAAAPQDREEGPFVYVRRDGAVFRAADSPRDFVVLLQAGRDWTRELTPYAHLRLFPSRAAAEAELDFLDLPPQA